MRLIDTKWLLYGESPVPWWVLAAVVIALIILGLGWMRIELKRSSKPARLMPFTLGLLILMAGWLIYRPVLIRVQTFEHDGQSLSYVDASDSMDSPFAAPDDKSAQMDLLSMYESKAVTGRPTAPRLMQQGIDSVLASGAAQRQALGLVDEELTRGVPVGDAARRTVDDYKTWATKTKSRLRALLAQAQLAAEAIPKEQAGAAADSFQKLLALSKQVELLRDDVGDLSGASVRTTLLPLDELLLKAEAAGLAMPGLQAAADAAFYAKNETLLKPKLDKIAKNTRQQVVRDVLKRLHVPDDAVSINESHKDQTDIYGDLRDILRLHENEVVSSLYAYSDGGNNVAGNEDVVDEIKRAGIDFTAIGAGSPSATGRDFAILDWDIRRHLVSKRDFTLTATLKTPPGVKAPVRLLLSTEAGDLATGDFTSAGNSVETFTLKAKAPDPGRHVMRLAIAAGDSSARNDIVNFVVDCADSAPSSLLIGSYPDWDASYFAVAAARAGISMRQDFPSDSPRRGDAVDAVPNTPAGWARYRSLLLKDAPFKGFSDKDADDLFKYVTQIGGSLFLIVDDQSYFDALAHKFGWNAKPQPLVDTDLRVAAGATHFPMVRIGVDGAQSAQIFAALGRVERAFSVPGQQASILLNAKGVPVFSVGFYGRGKVYLLGLRGMYKIREYDRGPRVDRFFKQMMEDAAGPLVPASGPGAAAAAGGAGNSIAWYPEIPVVNRENIMLSFANSLNMQAGDPPRKLTMFKGIGSSYGEFTPAGAGVLQVQSLDSGNPKPAGQITAARNPGMEEIYDEFDEGFMKKLAADCNGRYLPIDEATTAISSRKPITWTESTAERFPLADHWGLILAMIFVATIHWILRKMAGLAI